MPFLSDEIWSEILEMGVATYSLSCTDLCSLPITSLRHNRLSRDPSLWSILVTLDFSQEPQTNSSSSPALPSKALYKTMFERSTAPRVAARIRAILIAESNAVVCMRGLEDLERQRQKEGERMKAAVHKMNNLDRVSCCTDVTNQQQHGLWKALLAGRRETE